MPAWIKEREKLSTPHGALGTLMEALHRAFSSEKEVVKVYLPPYVLPPKILKPRKPLYLEWQKGIRAKLTLSTQENGWLVRVEFLTPLRFNPVVSSDVGVRILDRAKKTAE